MKKIEFKKIYWGPDDSTEAVFEPICTLPSLDEITTCFVFATDNKDMVVMSHPKRGWGFPGGHIESGVTPEDCAIRETYEESAVKIKNLRLIGHWKITKRWSSDYNSSYPDTAYQLLYLAKIDTVDDFSGQYETDQREIVPFDNISEYRNDDNFKAIFAYAVRCLKNCASSRR